MYKRIIALCICCALASGCLFSVTKFMYKAGTTAVQVESIDIVDEGENLFRVDENYNRKE